MNIEGEICAYIRGRKNKMLAVNMAEAIFSMPRKSIIATLQTYGLMDQHEQYIEPIRVTGKQTTVGQRASYPAF